MNLLWIDTETTGLKPCTDEIIDIALIETTMEGMTTQREYFSKIKPVCCVEEAAQRVNGYSEEKWEFALTDYEVFKSIRSVFPRNDGPWIPAGWNTKFDIDFLKNSGHIAIPGELNLDYHCLDLFSMSFVKYYSMSFSELCSKLNVNNQAPHTALGDVNACIKCYRALQGNRT